MKPFFLYLILCFLFISCEDVIEVDLDTIQPRLVVEASIEWEKGTEGNSQTISLSQSTPYFDTKYLPVTTAEVKIKNLGTNEVLLFQHTENGVYATNQFKPKVGANYELIIQYNNDTYTATSQLIGVTPVTKIEQTLITDFDGEEAIRLRFFTNDTPAIENFYLVSYKRENEGFPYLTIRDDEFRDGNEIPFLLQGSFTPSEKKLEVGEQIEIEYMGITEDYATYMELLVDQSYNGGSPFASTPVTLNGNIINTTSPELKPFGYFYLSEKEVFTVTIEQP